MGDPFDVRDPTALIFQAVHNPTTTADAVLAAAHEETDRLATNGPAPGELDRVKARVVARMLHDLDPVLGRALNLAALEVVHGRADLISELPSRIAAITEDQVRAAAGALQPQRRAVVEVVPGGAR
jgi:predicted Zn-dependent peptidase